MTAIDAFPVKEAFVTARGSATATSADFGNIIDITGAQTLFSTTDASYQGKQIIFASNLASELTFLAGTATIRGNTKINQNGAVTAICMATGAGAGTVWLLIGGSA